VYQYPKFLRLAIIALAFEFFAASVPKIVAFGVNV
jgi:hypothetical protein